MYFYKSKILLTDNARLFVSNTVNTGTLLGICNVELIFTIISTLSLNGGQAIQGCFEFAATTPDKALLLPATVIQTNLSCLLSFKTFNTVSVFL